MELKPISDGVQFKNGKLYIFGYWSKSIVVATPWPNPRQWVKTEKKPEWRGSRLSSPLDYIGVNDIPDYAMQLLLPLPEFSNMQKKRDSDFRRYKAYKAYYEVIPKDVKIALKQYKDRQWHLFSMLARCPGALDLSFSTPALAYMMASCWAFHKPSPQKALRTMRGLIRKKQIEQFRWLGFPPERRVINMLRKIPSGILSIERMFYLRNACFDKQVMKTLCHMEKINEEVLRIISDPNLFPYVTFSFLEEVSNREVLFGEPHMAWHLASIIKELRRMNIPLMTFSSIKKLSEIYWSYIYFPTCNRRELSEEQWVGLTLPHSPLKSIRGVIRPVSSTDELLAHTQKQSNCAFSCVERLSRNNCYLYEGTVKEETLTICVQRKDHGLALGEILGRKNANPTKRAVAFVEKWFLNAVTEREKE